MLKKEIADQLTIAASQKVKEREYWLNKLSDLPAAGKFFLPLDDKTHKRYSKERSDAVEMEAVAFDLPGVLSEKLIKLGSGSDYTLHMILVAGIKALLQRYNGSNDIILCSPIYKQDRETEFINTVLVFRDRLDQDMRFKELLLQVRKTIIEATENYSYPLELLMEELNIGDGSRLFHTILLLDNIHDKRYIRHIAPGIIFSFKRTGEHMLGKLEYSSFQYKKSTMERLVTHFECLLERALFDVEIRLKDIDILTVEERNLLLYKFNHTKADYPADKTIPRLFKDQAIKTPGATAVHSTSDIDLLKTFNDLREGEKTASGKDNLLKKIGNCCFKKNPYIFQFDGKRALETLNIFSRQEQDRLVLLRTHKLNYAAVNQPVLSLLDYFDGETNLYSIFKGIAPNGKKQAFLIYSIGKPREESDFFLAGKKSILVGNVLEEIVPLIKELYEANLIDLYRYKPGLVNLPVQLVEEAIPVTRPPGDRNRESRTGSGPRVLLLGDRTGQATTGLLYIASFLRRKGIEAYCQWNDINETKQLLKENTGKLLAMLRPVIVGVSMKWFPHIARVLEICKIVKEFDPSIKVVAGGNTASYYKDQVIASEWIDYVVGGDGEVPFLAICRGEDDIPNCTYKKDGKIIETPVTYVQDEKNSGEIYLSHLDEIFVLKKDPYLAPYFYINTGKGCSMQCLYCGGCRDAQEQIFKRPKPFLRGIREVRRDIQEAMKYTSTFLFDFDLPAYDSLDYYKEIWDGIDLSRYFCKFYFWKLPPAGFLDLVVKTFRYVCINIDICSLSEDHRRKLSALKLVKPQPTDEELFSFFDLCETYENVEIVINQITGLPYFTLEDIEKSSRVLTRLLENYTTLKAMDWGRLHSQPGAPVVDTCEQYDMHCYGKTYRDFLHYSQMNLDEEKYPVLLTFHYPYIYFNDDHLNSRISKFYVDANKKIETYQKELKKSVMVSETISYQELDQQSAALASLLKAKGIQPGAIIGIMGNPSIAVVVGILGILKAGAAYLPIDADYPGERINYMLADSGAGVLLLDRETTPDTAAVKDWPGHILTLPFTSTGIPREEQDEPAAGTSSLDLAYTIYTSGSTGKPKGVMINHRNVVSLVTNQNFIDFTVGDRLLLTGTMSFDITTFEIWGALLNGLSLYLVGKDVLLDFQRLQEVIIKHKISVLHLVPQLFNQILSDHPGVFAGLKYFLVGGDVTRPGPLVRLRRQYPGLKIIHAYGPTENTTFSTTLLVDKNYSAVLPIGKPIANSTVYIIDKNNNIQLIGTPGELVVGGDGVSRGYLNNPELTNKKFLRGVQGGSFFKKGGGTPNLFTVSQMPYFRGFISKACRKNKVSQGISKKRPPGRRRRNIYYTGDLARWLPDGNIEFLGRIDDQVKVRGFRIEPGEIETRLLAHKKIEEAAVIIKEENTGDKYLTAYVVPVKGSHPGETQLKEYLEDLLPEYMVPGFFVLLEEMPVTIHGKINRQALLERRDHDSYPGTADYVAPRNRVEEELVDIWSQILQIEKDKIGIDANFFDLGGHSLKAAILISKIHKTLHTKIPYKELFRIHTIRELSGYIEKNRDNKYISLEAVEEKEYYDISHAQKRLWIIERMEEDMTAYILPMVYVFEGNLDRGAFEKTFQTIAARHESLRTTFIIVANEPKQKIHHSRQFEFKVRYIDLRKKENRDQESQRLIVKEAKTTFNLEKGPLLRLILIHLEEEKYIFLYIVHHIICDGWSMRVMFQEFMLLYHRFRQGKGNRLAPLRIHYKDYSTWHNHQLKGESLERHRQYWLKQFSGELPALKLPTDYERPAVKTFSGSQIKFTLDEEISASLEALCRETDASLFMVLLAAVNILLFIYSNYSQEYIVIGAPSAGREHNDLLNQVGFYINTLPIRTKIQAGDTFKKILVKVKETLLDTFEHQVYPFDMLVEELGLNAARDSGRNPLFDVMVVLQNTNISVYSERIARLENLQATKLENPSDSSAFELNFDFVQTGKEIILSLLYNKNLYEELTIEIMGEKFINLIIEICRDIAIPVNTIRHEDLMASGRQQIETWDMDIP